MLVRDFKVVSTQQQVQTPQKRKHAGVSAPQQQPQTPQKHNSDSQEKTIMHIPVDTLHLHPKSPCDNTGPGNAQGLHNTNTPDQVKPNHQKQRQQNENAVQANFSASPGRREATGAQSSSALARLLIWFTPGAFTSSRR
ncbi:hypothetical protein MHYP_G00361870 [Metynnis hypsauchen]